MRERSGRPAPLAAALLLLLLAAAPQRSTAQGLLLGDRLGSTPSLGRLLDRAGAGASNTAAINTASGGEAGGGINGPFAVAAGSAAGNRTPAPAPAGGILSASASSPLLLRVS